MAQCPTSGHVNLPKMALNITVRNNILWPIKPNCLTIYTENEIMKVHSPKFQKRLGRTVANFNQSVWDSNCEVIMIRANRLKYSQNPELKQRLVNTGNKEIVEASPYDKIWGIGLNPYDPNVEDKTKWKGENKLGKCLMIVRDELN